MLKMKAISFKKLPLSNTIYNHLGFFKAFGRPGLAEVVIHRPVETRGLGEEDLVNLRHTVRTTIEKTIQTHEHRHQNR